MTYTGNVTVGGRADVRELSHLVVEKLAVGPFDNNSYLLRCVSTGAQVLVDAAAEPERLLELIGDDGIEAVVTTHRHRDHWAALAAVVEATGARTIAHVDDAPGIDVTTDGGRAGRRHHPGRRGRAHRDPPRRPHARARSRCSTTTPPARPTCSPATACSRAASATPRRTPARFASLYADVSTKLFDRLPDETWVYPGHGKDTTLGAERPHLEEWRERGW